GEALIPYHYFHLLTEKKIDTWLVVHSRCQKELSEHFPEAQKRMVFLGDSSFEKFLYKLENLQFLRILNQPLALFRQMLFHYRQSSQVKKLVRDKKINLIHQP